MKTLSLVRYLSLFFLTVNLFATQYWVTVEVFTETW